MSRHFLGPLVALILCCAMPLYGAQRGKGGGGRSEGGGGREEQGRQPNNEAKKEGANKQGANKQNSGKKSPGGAWSEDSNDSQNHKGAEDAAAEQHRNQPQATGAQGAAAGAAAEGRNSSQATGAQGAAAGAAAAKSKQPNYSGAQGAAAGAAAANKKQPNYSGAQGAAAGAAVAKSQQPASTQAQCRAPLLEPPSPRANQPQYSGAQGAAAGAAIANRNSPQYTGAQGAAGYAAVRNSFDHPELYGQGWYGAHPGIWAPAGLAAGAVWAPTAWNTLASTNGYASATPVSYNYGANVTCQQGNVMVDGQSVGTAEDFSQQASDLAETGAAATVSDDDKWMPLGVFAMVRNENQHPQMILQMAVNQQGVLRGNFTDEVTDHTMPIQGAVDSQTQRAAWTVGDNKDSVMEAGLSNLTEPEARALLHKNGKTQRWLLVRLDQPAAQAQN